MPVGQDLPRRVAFGIVGALDGHGLFHQLHTSGQALGRMDRLATRSGWLHDDAAGVGFHSRAGLGARDAERDTGGRRTIAVLSPNYFRSVHGEAEWRVAYASDPTGEKSLLVPVRVAECDAPGLLTTRVHIDLVGLDEDAARGALLRGAQQTRAKPTLEPALPGRQAPGFPPAAAIEHDSAAPTQPTTEEQGTHLQHLLRLHERNVQILEQKEARYAGDMPVHLVAQLEEEREAVSELQRRLRLDR